MRNLHLRKAGAVKVGADPGITRAVQSKVKVSHNPLVYVYDTPGVLEPSFKDMETGFKLACLNCIKGYQLNAILLADYLLFKLNKAKLFEYTQFYNLKEPTDDINKLLIEIAISQKKYKIHKSFDGSHKKLLDLDLVANAMIKHFFEGRLGKIMLDDDYLDSDFVSEMPSDTGLNSQNDNTNYDPLMNKFV